MSMVPSRAEEKLRLEKAMHRANVANVPKLALLQEQARNPLG